jgi:hypothetical protein
MDFKKGGVDITGVFLNCCKIFLSDLDILRNNKEQRTILNSPSFSKVKGNITEKTHPHNSITNKSLTI